MESLRFRSRIDSWLLILVFAPIGWVLLSVDCDRPAIHRLEIEHGKFDQAIIAPHDQTGFIAAPVERVPTIVASLRRASHPYTGDHDHLNALF